jgi:hypothetical protein
MAQKDEQSRLPGHLTYTPKRRQQPAGEGTDQPLAPTFLADKGELEALPANPYFTLPLGRPLPRSTLP